MLEDRIMNDYKQAMKDKDALKVSTLSFLRAQLKYALIDKKVEKLPDSDAITVIKKQVKQREDSISQFKQGNRLDLAEKEMQELTVLKSYLPQEMSSADLGVVVDEVIKETKATSIKDMGQVMKNVLAKLAGGADNKAVSEMVKEKLSKA